MRSIIWLDIRAVDLELYDVCPVDRAARVQKIIQKTEAADKYRKRFRRWHSEWGNGSLSGAAGTKLETSEQSLDNIEYMRCVLHVVQGLDLWFTFKALLSQKRRTSTLAPSDQVPIA